MLFFACIKLIEVLAWSARSKSLIFPDISLSGQLEHYYNTVQKDLRSLDKALKEAVAYEKDEKIRMNAKDEADKKTK